MSLVHLAKINNIFFQLSAEVMKSLDFLKLKAVTIAHNQTLVDSSENIKQFSTLQKHLSLSPMDTIKDMHLMLYVYICSVCLSEKITQFSTLKTYLSLSR